MFGQHLKIVEVTLNNIKFLSHLMKLISLVLGEGMWQNIEKVISKRQSSSCSLSDIIDWEMYRKLTD